MLMRLRRIARALSNAVLFQTSCMDPCMEGP